MFRYLLPLCVLLLCARSAGAQHSFTADPDPVQCSRLVAAKSQMNLESASSAGKEYDVKYLRCFWKVDPAVHFIQGSVTTWFKPIVDPLGHIDFDFSFNMQADSVKFHGLNLPFQHTANDVLSITLLGFIPPGQLDSVTVYYHGAPVTGQGFGSFVTSTHNNSPILWTLSEPYGAKEWWPCKQALSDKADSLDVYVTAPSTYKVAGNGLLKSVTQTTSGNISHWHSKYPIAAYLVAMAVTDYAEYSDYVPYPGGSIQVLNYVYPEYLAQAQSESGDIVEIMQLYNDRAGLYPFYQEKYGHAQFGFGGGQEHQTMGYMANLSFGLMAHELAHQWFGDKITCGSWQDIWLNEGFATYFEGLSREAFFPPATWYNWKLGRINNIISVPDGSVFVPDTTDIYRIFSGRLTYNKGAYLLHMLRWKLGDANFFQALREYQLDPALAFGYAHTSDLKAHLEAVSGQDLTSFFQQWFYGEGYPSYQLNCSQNQGYFEGTIGQTVSTPASVPFFDIAVPVKVFGPNGQDSTLVLQPQPGGPTPFSFLIPFAIDSVKFDPDLWILSGNNSVTFQVTAAQTQTIETGLKVSPNPVKEKLYLKGVALPGEGRIFLLDAPGHILAAAPVPGPKEAWKTAIDMSAYPSGVYFVKVGGTGWESRPVKVIKSQ